MLRVVVVRLKVDVESDPPVQKYPLVALFVQSAFFLRYFFLCRCLIRKQCCDRHLSEEKVRPLAPHNRDDVVALED